MNGYTLDISFISDGLRLDGVLHHPGTRRPPVVVGSHGLESNGDSPKQIELAQACNAMDIAYFRFHHRGCGTSEGHFPDVTTLDNRKRDLVNAVALMKSRDDIGPNLALFGSSIGGSTCIAAASEINAEAYVLIAPPVYGNTLLNAPERTGREPALPESFYTRLLAFDLSGLLPAIRNILVFHGDRDDIVPLENGKAVHALSAEPKRIVIQHGGDHRITALDHQEEFMREAMQWYKTWIDGIA
jgi:alpha-beta hydrolase superfamily lysophospholipase